MARLHTVKKARKDYPEDGIKKGDTYYWWQFRFGPKMRSKTYPKRSQLTQSDFYIWLYDLEDSIDALVPDKTLEDEVANIISEIDDMRDELQSRLDVIPEQLQDSGSGEILQERIDALDEWSSGLQSIDFDVDTNEDDNEEGIDAEEQKYEDLLDDVKSYTPGI